MWRLMEWQTLCFAELYKQCKDIVRYMLKFTIVSCKVCMPLQRFSVIFSHNIREGSIQKFIHFVITFINRNIYNIKYIVLTLLERMNSSVVNRYFIVLFCNWWNDKIRNVKTVTNDKWKVKTNAYCFNGMGKPFRGLYLSICITLQNVHEQQL